MKKAAVGLAFAGFKLFFKSDSWGVISILRERYGRFVAAAGPGYKFEAFASPGRKNPFKPVVVLSGRTLVIRRGDFEAELNIRARAGTLKADLNEQCLDAFLRSLLSFLLLRTGGFMLHSAGLIKNGKAYLFLGRSGAGKSTLSKLAVSASSNRKASVEVISDEINLLRFEKGRFRVYGSPFWGEMRSDGRQGNWPLGGIYLLKKAKNNRVRRCSAGESLKMLLRCLVNFDKQPGTAENVMRNAARLLAEAEIKWLEFSKADSGFLAII